MPSWLKKTAHLLNNYKTNIFFLEKSTVVEFNISVQYISVNSDIFFHAVHNSF